MALALHSQKLCKEISYIKSSSCHLLKFRLSPPTCSGSYKSKAFLNLRILSNFGRTNPVKLLNIANNKNLQLQSMTSYFLSNNKRRKLTNMPPITDGKNVNELIDKHISEKLFLFSKSFCPFCKALKGKLRNEKIGFKALEIDLLENGSEVQAALKERTGQNTVPNVFVNGNHVGGFDKVSEMFDKGEFLPLLNPKTHSYEYDMVVIGGGSGGLACSKACSRLGAKVAVCDFVTPTPLGTSWGLGGTCVNVGCIPKKLMHQAALLEHDIKDSIEYGWEATHPVKHDWAKLIESIQNHIGSLNWGFKVELREKKIDYFNSRATFLDAHTVTITDRKDNVKTLTSDKFLIASGGRPRYPAIPGAKEYGITSDDIFSLPHSPGKTLFVGASYISLECAGFLIGLGYDVTVMVRSILLRGFDRQMAEMIGKTMEERGVKFIRETVPTSLQLIEEGNPGKILVKAESTSGEEIEEEYNTVVFAIGREPCTREIGLEDIGVQLSKNSSKVVVDQYEASSLANVFAVGDVIEGGLELTPVAIQAGKLLAQRLYGNGERLMDYINVPTTVFTPVEYGSVGYSEEAAIAMFGEKNIEVYHSNFWPLEYTVAHRPNNECYAKLIVHKKDEKEYVVGLHYLGPNAGEVIQGFSIALKLNATKEDFDDLVGIHPTNAENFTFLDLTKSSGKDASKAGC